MVEILISALTAQIIVEFFWNYDYFTKPVQPAASSTREKGTRANDRRSHSRYGGTYSQRRRGERQTFARISRRKPQANSGEGSSN